MNTSVHFEQHLANVRRARQLLFLARIAKKRFIELGLGNTGGGASVPEYAEVVAGIYQLLGEEEGYGVLGVRSSELSGPDARTSKRPIVVIGKAELYLVSALDELEQNPADEILFAGDQWKEVSVKAQAQKKIAVIASLLGAIIENVSRSNEAADSQALNPVERQQLIAILETALAVLKAPIVEKGLLTKAGEMLENSAKKAAEKQVQEGLGKMMNEAASKIFDVITTFWP